MTVVETILTQVAEAHVITPDELVGACRRRELVDARSEAARRLYDETDLRIRQIGHVLGGRHHSTVIDLIRRGQVFE